VRLPFLRNDRGLVVDAPRGRLHVLPTTSNVVALLVVPD
jgi:hypothetical protein